MNTRLIAWLFPEVRNFEKASERKEAVRYATQRMYLNAYYLVSVIVMVVVLLQARLSVERFVEPSRFVKLIVAGLVGVALGTCGPGAALLLSRKRIRRRLRERLNAAGIPVCMRCGYSFEGSAESRCPECGQLRPLFET